MCYVIPILSPFRFIQSLYASFLKFIGFFIYLLAILPMHVRMSYAIYSLYLHVYLLDISRQLACTKLGSRGKYRPMQYCWVHTSRLLGYLVHTCHLPIDIQQIYCSTQTGQHSHLQRSCCPVWVLQPIHTCAFLLCQGFCTLVVSLYHDIRFHVQHTMLK